MKQTINECDPIIFKLCSCGSSIYSNNSAHIQTWIQPTYNQTENLKTTTWKQPKQYTQENCFFGSINQITCPFYSRSTAESTSELILQEGYNYRCKRVSFRMSAFIFVGQVIFFNRERCCKDARKSCTTNIFNLFPSLLWKFSAILYKYYLHYVIFHFYASRWMNFI